MPKERTPKLKIKDFGRDRDFDSVADLKKALSEEYKSKDVSILYTTKPHGLLRVVYVSVDDAGAVLDSYKDQAPIDFNAIENELLL